MMTWSKRQHLFATILIVLLFFSSGVVAGRSYTLHAQVKGDATGAVDITKVVDLYSKSRSSQADFNEFWAVWDKVKAKYVEQPTSDVDMFYGAIQGMVAGLGDPHSIYFPPKKAEEFTKDLAGEFDGIGAEIGKKDAYLQIVAALPQSPAERAGLKSGDIIFAIDGKDITNTSVDEAVASIRGKAGTTVTLSIARTATSTRKDVVITRDKINIPTVEWRMEANNTAYVHILFFNENTWTDFDKTVTEIQAKNPSGLILDMRSNPGGYLDSSVKVASEWIPEGQLVVREVFQANKKNEYVSKGTHRFVGIKTVVLVDEGTASGAEIVAGALQDYKFATLVGAKTYGKGSVQEFEVLPDGSALKLTVAKWFTPHDQVIDKKGITPDVVLSTMAEKTKTGEIKDLGLAKALEILKK